MGSGLKESSTRGGRRPGATELTSALVVVLAGAAICLAGCGSMHAPATREAGVPHELLAEARPIGRGPRFHPGVSGPVLGACRRGLGRRFAVHVEVFAADHVVIVPARIGTRPPLRLSAGRIVAAACYGSLVTLEPTGVVLLRPAAALSLGELFRSWGQPLSRRRLASFTLARGSQTRVFVDGRRWAGAPALVPLARHADIVLEAGPYVPPHPSFRFPAGT